VSLEAVEWVLKHSRSKGATRLVALVIAHRTNYKVGYAYPALDTIAEEAGIRRASLFPSRKNGNGCLAKLQELGELEIEPGGGSHKTNRYRLKLVDAQASLFDKTGTATAPESGTRTGAVLPEKQVRLPHHELFELKTKEASSSIAASFSVFGFSEPFGHTAFQSVVIARAPERHNGNIIEVMERVIQDCQSLRVKLPRKFYEEKHRLEAELRKAKEESDPGGKQNGYRRRKLHGADLDRQIIDAAQNAGRRPV
jgi:hypothetical protein